MKAEANIQRSTPNAQHSIQKVFEEFVVPTYARLDLVLERGEGSYVWDVNGKRYLDLGGGIAVNALGHANEEIAGALNEQARRLVHVSNLYYTEPQGRLAKRIVDLIAPGRVFFCNSGAEANEGLFKLARKFGLESNRFEIITAINSFHGRTLAGIAATGQEKIKKGFDPAVAGFKHVPFNDLAAMREAVTRSTRLRGATASQAIAILVEPVQGESGITIATCEYLSGLRELCDERGLLLMFDEVQAGHFRTGKFQSWQTILSGRVGVPPAGFGVSPNQSFSPSKVRESETLSPAGETPTLPGKGILPDAVAMAKSLGGGFPMGAFWVREKFANVLSAGSHASTFGGAPLACAVALKIFEVIERDGLAENARSLGGFLLERLRAMKYPNVIREVRGLGLMIGIEFQAEFNAIDVVKRLHERGVLTVPAGNAVVRLLPPLNLSRDEAEEGLRAIESVVVDLART